MKNREIEKLKRISAVPKLKIGQKYWRIWSDDITTQSCVKRKYSKRIRKYVKKKKSKRARSNKKL